MFGKDLPCKQGNYHCANYPSRTLTNNGVPVAGIDTVFSETGAPLLQQLTLLIQRGLLFPHIKKTSAYNLNKKNIDFELLFLHELFLIGSITISAAGVYFVLFYDLNNEEVIEVEISEDGELKNIERY